MICVWLALPGVNPFHLTELKVSLQLHKNYSTGHWIISSSVIFWAALSMKHFHIFESKSITGSVPGIRVGIVKRHCTAQRLLLHNFACPPENLCSCAPFKNVCNKFKCRLSFEKWTCLKKTTERVSVVCWILFSFWQSDTACRFHLI